MPLPQNIVIGSGPNGLSAAIVLARAGRPVTLYEQSQEIGGGTRTEELTLPGFLHDVCSAVHPMAASSPCFDEFGLAPYGLEWVHAPSPLAHPLDDGTAVVMERSLDATAGQLGAADGAAWRGLFGRLAAEWMDLRQDLLRPLSLFWHPVRKARFGFSAVRSARGLAEGRFRGERARALFAGLAAHSTLPLEASLSASIGLVLGACAHSVGWPFPRGGSGRIADALAACLRAYGGRIVTGGPVAALPEDGIVLCDVTPRQLLALGGERLPEKYRRHLAAWKYGPGAFKVDFALDGPVPWSAPECRRAGTVHLGGTLEEIAQWEATHTGRPFVLLTQLSLFDASRAPAGKHTVWTYCHVPNGSSMDMTAAIEDQIERFAPGFRSRILARSVRGPAALESYNPNLVGGDFNGGALTPRQFFRMSYRTPVRGVYLCSSSTAPGGGVHGMCGYHAAARALRG